MQPFLSALAAVLLLLVPLAAPAGAAGAADELDGHGDPERVPPAVEQELREQLGTAETVAGDIEDDEPFHTAGQSLPRPQILLRGGGWGHGVGMSQYGARAMADSGRSYGQILRHYYSGVAIESRQMPGHFTVGLLNPNPPGSGNRRFDFARASIYAESGGSNIQWQRCAGSCTNIASQPATTTWRVTRLSDGRLRISAGASTIWQQSSGQQVNYLRVRMANAGRPVQVEEKPGISGNRGRSYLRGELQIRPSPRNASDVMIGVRVFNFDQYLWGLGEVPFSWHGNALRAQVLAARTFAARHQQASGCACDITDGPDTQVYRGYDWERGAGGDRWRSAVTGTSGQVITYDGRLISAFYSSSHHKRSEHVQDSWAYTATTADFPYLRSVSDPWSGSANNGNLNRTWVASAGHGDFANLVAGSLAVVTRVEVVSRTAGGSPKTLRISGFDSNGKRQQVTYSGTATYPVAASILRQSLPAAGFGSWGGRLKSQQLDRIGLAPFIDDLGSPHEYAAVILHHLGITKGCASNRYCPQDPIRRDHMARFLREALDLPPGDELPFTDVPADSEFRDDIAAVYKAGITQGYADGTFRPLGKVTRGEMATFLVRGFGYPPAGDQGFTDVAKSAHKDAINALAAAGVTTGYTDGTFRPHADVTRGEMATLVARALGYDV